jgi:hypothetical protein
MASSPVQIKCKGVLFDMDGILVSSIGSVVRSWSIWARMRGVDPQLTCKIAHGQRAIDTLAQLRPDLDSEAELKIIEDLEVEDNDDLTVLPGVLDLLAALPARNGKHRWTVVTSATERLARARMAAGGVPAPDELVTADFVTRGKPHPEPYLAGAPGPVVRQAASSSPPRSLIPQNNLTPPTTSSTILLGFKSSSIRGTKASHLSSRPSPGNPNSWPFLKDRNPSPHFFSCRERGLVA